MVALSDLAPASDGRRLVVDAGDEVRVALPADGDLLKADFQRIDDDLLISPPGGREIVVRDYFAGETPPDLLIGDKAYLRGELVERLAIPADEFRLAENNTSATDQIAQANSEAIGKVESVTGTVTVQHQDGSSAQLAAGDPIFLHDVVVAGADGSIGIVFVDGTTFSLSEGARMTMDEMVYDAAGGGGSFVTSVLQGTFVFSTGSIAPNGEMSVNTPVGTIGIRGTTVAARIAIEGSDTIIILLPDADGHVGRVFIQNGGGIQEITEANAATTVTSFFIAPSQPVVLPASDVLQYFDQVLQQLRSIEGTGPSDNQGGSTEEEVDGDQALLDAFDPSTLSTAAGGEEAPGEGDPGAELQAVDSLSSLLGFIPDPLAPVSFFSVNLGGNVGLGGLTWGSAGYGPGGITLDYLDPSSAPLPADISKYTVLTGGPGNDSIDGGPFTGPLIILGNAGDDTLTGSSQNDIIYGLGGNDTLIAGHGGGNDVIDGGTDGDTVKYASADEPMIIDLTAGKAYGDKDVGVDKLVNIENVFGGSGNDVITGDKNVNKLDGNIGDDQIAGLGGADIIDGNAGEDTAVFTGDATDYDIFVNEDSSITIVDQRANGDGTDTLLNVEWLQFADQKAAVPKLEGGINQAPTDIELDQTIVAENSPGAIVGAVTVSDPDDGDTHTFVVSDNRFEVVDGILRLKDGVALDFEAEPGPIAVTITATDEGGLIRTETFEVIAANVNEAPAKPADTDGSANRVSEAAAAGSLVGIVVQASDPDAGDSLTYSLADDAGGRFVIDAVTGEVRVAEGAAFDHETTAHYDVMVTATDKAGLSSTETFTIAIADAMEPIGQLADIDAAANTIAEDSVVGSAVGITAKATDVDAGDTISYSLLDDAGGRFAIDAATGVVTLAGALDYEVSASHQIIIQAVSSDGSASSRNFTIEIADANDNPVIGLTDGNPIPNIVAENAAIGTAVGITAQASDADKGASVTYALLDDAAGRFAIDQVTGLVTVAAALDYEAATSHQITIQAISSDGSTAEGSFVIQVGDADDVPVAVDDTPALAIDALNASIEGVNLLDNDSVGIDTPGHIDAIRLAGGTFLSVDADGTDLYIKADGSLGSAGDNIGMLHIEQDGDWSFVQKAGSDLDDLHFEYRLVDGNGDSDSAGFSVDLHDPTPVNYNDAISTQAADQQNNVLILLDCSGSMGDTTNGLSRLQLAKNAIANMLAQYDDAGELNVIVVGFSTNATAMTSWGGVDAAMNFIDSLTAGGNTNYAAGINAATGILTSEALQDQLLGGPVTVYFMSDGEPSSGTSLTSNTSVREAWDQALINEVDRVVAVAMGSDIQVTDPDLIEVANPNGGGAPINSVIQVTNFTDLSAALAGTVATASGNVLDGSLTSGKGDDGAAGVTPDRNGDPLTRLATLSYVDPNQGNGTTSLTISWNGVAALVSGAAAGQVISNQGGVITFQTDSGIMTFYFVDDGQRHAGDFTFTANAANVDRVETFQYTTIDADGDLDPDGGATLTIEIPADHSLRMTPVATGFQPGPLTNIGGATNGGDTLVGNAGDNRIDGGNGNDVLAGGEGNDWLIGGAGNDQLNGGAGNDYLDGGLGNDAMAGGIGNDAYIVGSTTDLVTEQPGQGHDTVFAAATFTLTDNVEDLILTGSGNIDGTGNNADNQVFGNGGSNQISGGDGSDYLAAGGGSDTVLGGSGNDFIAGGAGNDLMTGGSGNDLFHNQAPADNYSVGTNASTAGIAPTLYDRITDFDAASDKIVFSASYDGAGGWTAGHVFTEGLDFSRIDTAYDGTNGSGTAYAAGDAALILDAGNNLIYDANGAEAGYTIVAQIQPAGGTPEVTAANVTIGS